MKKISIAMGGSNKYLLPGEQSPWKFFLDQLEASGLEVVDGRRHPDLLVNINHGSNLLRIDLNRPRKLNRVLIVMEPRCVNPANHSPRVRSKYGRVFVSSRLWLQSNTDRLFDWPQSKIEDFNFFSTSNERTNRIVMVAANNFSVSSSELYSLRRQLVTQSNLKIDVYGRDWQASRIKIYGKLLKSLLRNLLVRNLCLKLPYLAGQINREVRIYGSIENKMEALNRNMYSLILENSIDYFSEKLIDGIIGGTIPIYVGPDPQIFAVPRNVCAWVPPNCDEIEKKFHELENAPELRNLILEAGQDFLKSETYSQLVNTRALVALAHQVIEYFEDSSS